MSQDYGEDKRPVQVSTPWREPADDFMALGFRPAVEDEDSPIDRMTDEDWLERMQRNAGRLEQLNNEAEQRALSRGDEIIYDEDGKLLLDFDTYAQLAQYKRMRPAVNKHFRILSEQWWLSKSGWPHQHGWLKLDTYLPVHARIALQLILGSDIQQALWQLVRLDYGHSGVLRLFQPANSTVFSAPLDGKTSLHSGIRIVKHDSRAELFAPCVKCGIPCHVMVPIDRLELWLLRGMSVQAAFPDLPLEQREWLVSGLCPTDQQPVVGV